MSGNHGLNYGHLNIHYSQNAPVELLPPSSMERMKDRLKPMSTAVRELAISTRKSVSRQKAIHRRRASCKRPISDRIATYASPRPEVTERNLDQSPFLSLPLEIRQHIYELYYESDVVKIQDLTFDGTYFLTASVPLSQRTPPGRGQTGYIWKNLLGLPLTCRTIYPEAVEHLYARTSFRFTDPRLAMRIPDTIAMKHLQSISAIDFTFFLHLLIDYFKRSGVQAARSTLGNLKQKQSQSRKEASWAMFWSKISSLSGLKRISLQVWEYPGSPKVQMQPWMSQYILKPFLRFDKSTGIDVSIQVDWDPGPILAETFKDNGYHVLVNAEGVHTRSNVQRMRCSLRRDVEAK